MLFLLSVAARGQLLMNEICPSNDVVYEFEELGYSDWVEVYNPSGSEIDLENYFLTNDSLALDKWNFPDMELNAGAYQLFPAIELTSVDTIINFNLSSTDDYLLLTDGSTILSSVSWQEIRTDHSIGLKPASYFYFSEPTPNSANTTTAFKGYAQKPKLSISSRQLYEPSNLTISSNPGHDIYYFLNGHINESPIPFTAGIPLIETTTIAAFCKGDSLIDSRLEYGTYFFNLQHQLPIVHLQVDSLTLFDDSTGIYMLGYDYETEKPHWGANYWKDTAITAFFEYFDESTNLRTSQECDLKMHGGTASRTKPMKPLRLIGRKKYENDQFEFSFFENKSIDSYHRLLLRNSGSDFNKTHLLDGVFHQLAIDIGLDMDVQAYRPVVVYINGYYWGVHNLRERTDAAYLASHYEVNEDSVNLLEEEELWVIEGDSVEFETLANFIVDEDMSIQSNFELVDQQLDTRSMVDYFIFELYLNNRDWPYNNLKLWNAASHPRYRYFLNDLDAACKYYGSDPLDYHFLETLMGSWGDDNIHVLMLRSLLENAEFKRYFINRYADLVNTSLSGEFVLDYIHEAKAVIEPEMEAHFKRWPWPPYTSWEKNFERYYKFFADRVEIVREELSTVFELPESTPIYFGVYPLDGGTIDCNTIQLDEFPFSGNYFASNVIDLTAKSNTGTFLYWENLRTQERFESASIQIDPQEGDSLIAVFAERQTDFQLQLQPNPIDTYGQVSFSIADAGPIKILVHDLSGRLVMGYEYDYRAFGSYSTTLDFGNLIQGEYILSIHGEQGREGIKFVKL